MTWSLALQTCRQLGLFKTGDVCLHECLLHEMKPHGEVCTVCVAKQDVNQDAADQQVAGRDVSRLFHLWSPECE